MFIRVNDLAEVTSGPMAGRVGRVDEIAIRQDDGAPWFMLSIYDDGKFVKLPFFWGQLKRLKRDRAQIEAHVIAEAEAEVAA